MTVCAVCGLVFSSGAPAQQEVRQAAGEEHSALLWGWSEQMVCAGQPQLGRCRGSRCARPALPTHPTAACAPCSCRRGSRSRRASASRQSRVPRWAALRARMHAFQRRMPLVKRPRRDAGLPGFLPPLRWRPLDGPLPSRHSTPTPCPRLLPPQGKAASGLYEKWSKRTRLRVATGGTEEAGAQLAAQMADRCARQGLFGLSGCRDCVWLVAVLHARWICGPRGAAAARRLTLLAPPPLPLYCRFKHGGRGWVNPLKAKVGAALQ